MELLMMPITHPLVVEKFRMFVEIGLTSKYVQPFPATIAAHTRRGKGTGVSDEMARCNKKKPTEDTRHPTSSVSLGPTCCLRSILS
jgi:hypothetical protein